MSRSQDATESPDPSTPSKRLEDTWVDQVMPEGFDWVAVVREHPLLSMAVVAAGGFALGRWQGRQIVDAASEMVTERVTHSVDRLVDSARGR